MAGDEAAEGRPSRRRMDLIRFLGLPPSPRSPDSLDCPVSLPNAAAGPASVVPGPEGPVELLAPVVAYSPSNALSTPAEEQSMLDPFLYAWLDGEDGADAAEPAVVLGASVDGTDPSSLSRVAPGLEAYDDLTPWVERYVRPGRGATGVGDMVRTTSLLSQSVQDAADIEARTPELRFQRLIRISQQHSIVRTGSANPPLPGSPEADRLSWAIQRSHDSLELARRQKLDGDNKAGGKGAGNKDGCCGCNSSFECNICLDPAKEPVVTPCGHLFCWPCLYKWLHAHSVNSECPVCKGEVLEVNVTPIYGRGDDQMDASVLDTPPRPRANRTQSLRQQLQMADSRGIATVVRQMIENQGIVRGQPNPVEVPVVPASRRARVRRQQRQDSISSIMLNTGNVAAENGNQAPLPHSGADNTTPMVLVAPEQSSSVEQTSVSSTAAVIVGELGSSRRSRPSEIPTTRRTRRRQP